MSSLRRTIWPGGVLMLLLAAASLFFGAESRAPAFLFSGLLMALGALAVSLGHLRHVPRLGWVAGAILLGWVIVDLVTGRIAASASELAVLGGALSVFVTAAMAARRMRQLDRLWIMLLMVFLVFSIWAFVDFIISPETIHGKPRPYHEDRLSAAFLSANTAGTFFGVVLLAAAAPVLRIIRKSDGAGIFLTLEMLFRKALPALLAMLFAAICLLLTASRAGLAFAGLCLVLLVIWEIVLAPRGRAGRRWVMLLGLSSVLLITAIGFWVLSGETAGERYGELDADANIRLTMYSAYWQAFLQAPLFGHGLGSFGTVNNAIMTADNARILATQGAAHNFILQWLLQAGIVGTGIVFSLAGVALWRVFKSLETHPRQRTYLRAILIISLFVLLHGLVDYAIEIPGFVWWWVLLVGFGYGLSEQKPRASRRKTL